jgi:hypothetical protein
MTIETTLETVLRTTGKSVYPLALPEKPTYPAIVYQRISSVPKKTHDTMGHEEARFQITIWSNLYSAVVATTASVMALLDLNVTNFMFGYKLNQTDLKEAETGLYASMIDFSIWYS